ncbi:MAG TPA: SBBP repeat-containing protein, partial [Terriglobia bacterium]|nr:SBBP repeat-containing protein [Terriglobia bacterium]
PGKANYFIGNDPSKWRTNVPTYAKVRYESVYPGVDLVYYGTRKGELEYDFVVAPGADPSAIALVVEAETQPETQSSKLATGLPKSSRVHVDSDGDLAVPIEDDEVRLHKPVIYQPAVGVKEQTTYQGRRTPIEGHYTLDAHNHIRFELGPYDHNRPVVIDPVLIYATYLGGSGGDIAYAVAVDSVFNTYIAGLTNSTNFPTKGTPVIQSASKGNGDCFITEINPEGTQILYSTYLGGSQLDTATAIAESSGAIYVTGYTASVDFPVKVPAGPGTPEPFQQTYGGNTDAFVAEIAAGGSSLVYSSYLGGTGADFGQGIAVDPSGNAYVTGSTQSTNFPVSSNALQPNINGSQDAFVTKVNFSGEQVLYSTYLGGSAADVAQAIALDSSNDMYISGYTFSTDFPTVAPYQAANAGGADAFVAELNAAGSALTFSTYLGGAEDDRAYGIALDSSNNVYVAGATSSTNFPTNSAFQAALAGASNAFVTKFDAAGSSLVYSTYLGGSGTDQANAIAVTPAGLAYVTGFTNSSNFPTQSPIQAILGISNNQLCGTAPCADAFIAQFNAAGNALTYSTYLGGNGPDFGQAIAVDSTGLPYIAGSTSSTNFPVVWGGNYQSSLGGTAGNAFAAKIDTGGNPNASVLPTNVNFGDITISVTSPLQQITIVNPSTTPLTITQIYIETEINNSSTVFQLSDTAGCIGTIPGGGAYCQFYVSFTPNSVGHVTDEIYITDNAGGVPGGSGGLPGSQQIINLSGTGVTAETAVTVVPTSLSYSSQAVGTSSPPQSVSITNTGTETLDISSITTGTTGDFSQTNTCQSPPYNGSLAVGQSCTVSVVFDPTASGTRAASLSITDNATGSPQSVSLTGIGAAAFTLASPSAVNPFIIGDTQTTFVIQAQGPTSFNGAISLACSAGITCAFSTNPIFVGQNTTMTVSNLTTNPSSNPLPFTLTGTSGSQSTTLQLQLEFSDFTLTVTPSSNDVASGTSATYYVSVNPLYGLSTKVNLIISTTSPSLPDYTYTFTPTTATLNGTSPTVSTLVINTTKYLAPTGPAHAPPRFPGGKIPPLIFGLLSLAGLASLALCNKRRARHGWGGSGWLGVRLTMLSLIMALNLAMAACRANTLVITGTVAGSYVVTVEGTLASNTSVNRYVTLALAVTQGTQP